LIFVNSNLFQLISKGPYIIETCHENFENA